MKQGKSGGSLRVRMLLSATLVLILFLGIMGAVLDNAYRVSAEQTVSERLLLHVYALIAASNEDDVENAHSLFLPESLQEPHFNSPGTGLVGLVFDSTGREIWQSRSAVTLTLTPSEIDTVLAGPEPGVVYFDRLERTAEQSPLFYLGYRVIWQSGDDEAQYIYVVLEDIEPYRKEVIAFRNNLWGWLIGGVLLLVALQALIMRWGLLPIAGLEQDLAAIEAGKSEYLEGSYPQEIAGVTRNLNLLLEGERKQRERYRTTMADLAHSLKTPLAILKTESNRPDSTVYELSSTLESQVDRMDEIISYQLQRAVSSASLLVRNSVEIEPVLEKLTDALRKVYSDRGLVIETILTAEKFPGDERDLYELLGNLLDNACKYGNQLVRISISEDAGRLRIQVDDDGPGIDKNDRDRVFERGTRLDSLKSGQGIGLAVVTEIVERYRGSVSIDSSLLGGASVTVAFHGND